MAQYVLEILDGDRAGETVSLAQKTLRIGRKPGNDLVLADEKASGAHAEVVLEGERYVLRDLDSTNGTLMEGHRVKEVVLTPGDVFQIGRVRLRFRLLEADVAFTVSPEGGDAMQLHRIDAARLRKARGSRAVVAGLSLVLVAGLGAAAWFLYLRPAEAVTGTQGKLRRDPLVVEGNKLLALGSLESDEGWTLRAAGSGFQLVPGAHTGDTCAQAVYTAGEPPFALLRARDPLPVLGRRQVTAIAHLRTTGDAQAAVRMRFFGRDGSPFGPFVFTAGSALRSAAEWTQVQAEAVVPEGAERCTVEVLAVLPTEGSEARCDDIAVVEGAADKPLQLQLDSGQMLLGTSTSIAIRSTDTEQPALLLDLLPDGPGPLLPLQQQGLLTMSDRGLQPKVDKDDTGFRIEVPGANRLLLVFPAEAAAGLLVKGEQGFTGTASSASFQTTELLLGRGPLRALVRLPAPTAGEGRIVGNTWQLWLQGSSLQLQTQFRSERQAARDLLAKARQALRDGQPGATLEAVRDLLRTVPHDTELLGEASLLREQILAAAAGTLRKLQADLENAEFFDTRGGFERVQAGIDQLLQSHGEANLPEAAAAQKLRERAATRLAALQGSLADERRTRLQALADSFQKTGQAELERLVRDYLKGN